MQVPDDVSDAVSRERDRAFVAGYWSAHWYAREARHIAVGFTTDDRSVAELAAQTLGHGQVTQRKIKLPDWRFEITEPPEVTAVLSLLMPYLRGEVRLEAERVLKLAEDASARERVARLPRRGHCAVPGCERKIKARMLCTAHYSARARARPSDPTAAKLFDAVVADTQLDPHDVRNALDLLLQPSCTVCKTPTGSVVNAAELDAETVVAFLGRKDRREVPGGCQSCRQGAAPRKCSVSGCWHPLRARRLCYRHYREYQQVRDAVPAVKRPTFERLITQGATPTNAARNLKAAGETAGMRQAG